MGSGRKFPPVIFGENIGVEFEIGGSRLMSMHPPPLSLEESSDSIHHGQVGCCVSVLLPSLPDTMSLSHTQSQTNTHTHKKKAHTHKHTHTHTNTQTNTPTYTQTQTHTHTHSLSLSLYVSLSHTHTLSLAHSLSYGSSRVEWQVKAVGDHYEKLLSL